MALLRKAHLSRAVLLAGVVFSLYLQTKIRDEVFFSGDGGVKFLLARQFASGDLRSDLRLPVERWVNDLWATGFYPLEPPFAYEIGEHHYIKDPIFFSLATAPWYAAFGYRGLYVVPLLSLWAVWIAFLLVCRRLRFEPWVTALALFALIFASPLTAYGAMYWEHTLGVALAFGGLSLILAPIAWVRPAWNAALGGVLMGLSIWFRSELLCLVAAAVVLAFASPKFHLGYERRGPLLLGAAIAVAALFSLNLLVYGQPLGAHALSVVQDFSPSERLQNAAVVFSRIGLKLLEFFPLTVPTILVALAASGRSRWTVEPRPQMRFLLWICVLFMATVPVIVPSVQVGGDGGKQWGPRYLLAAIPLIGLLAAMTFGAVSRLRWLPWRALATAALAVALGVGVFINSYVGVRNLGADYSQRVLPALKFLEAHPARVVVFDHQFAVQEMAAALGRKEFFLANSPEAFERLSGELLDRGESSFLFLADGPVAGSARLTSRANRGQLRMSPVGRYGIYVIHEVSLARLPP